MSVLDQAVILSASEMYAKGMSIPQIVEITGVPRSTLNRQLVAAGIKFRSHAEAGKLAGPRISAKLTGRTHDTSDATREKISLARKKHAALHASGTTITQGYVVFTMGEHKGKAEHVVIMEKRIGRPLRNDEVVHHIDEDRSNNKENNLALMTNGGHLRHHRRDRKRDGQPS